MSHIETLQAMLERRLIRQMTRSLEESADPAQRERQIRALGDLVQHADPTLDARLIDEWTEACLRRHKLWVWDRLTADA
jgi:hypothetical protein